MKETKGQRLFVWPYVLRPVARMSDLCDEADFDADSVYLRRSDERRVPLADRAGRTNEMLVRRIRQAPVTTAYSCATLLITRPRV
jgi:hypothetical protein